MGRSCRCWRCQASRWSRACSRPAWRALRMASPRPSCSSLGVTYPTPAWSRTALYFARVAASSARSVAGSRIASRCGYSALTCPLRLSIQAWSVGPELLTWRVRSWGVGLAFDAVPDGQVGVGVAGSGLGELYPRLLAAVAAAALRTSLQLWLD